MPTPMGDEDRQELVDSSSEIDRYDYRNPEIEDDYFHAVLYRTPDGRYFRYIEMSGFDSQFHGSSGDADWVADNELDAWMQY